MPQFDHVVARRVAPVVKQDRHPQPSRVDPFRQYNPAPFSGTLRLEETLALEPLHRRNHRVGTHSLHLRQAMDTRKRAAKLTPQDRLAQMRGKLINRGNEREGGHELNHFHLGNSWQEVFRCATASNRTSMPASRNPSAGDLLHTAQPQNRPHSPPLTAMKLKPPRS